MYNIWCKLSCQPACPFQPDQMSCFGFDNHVKIEFDDEELFWLVINWSLVGYARDRFNILSFTTLNRQVLKVGFVFECIKMLHCLCPWIIAATHLLHYLTFCKLIKRILRWFFLSPRFLFRFQRKVEMHINILLTLRESLDWKL